MSEIFLTSDTHFCHAQEFVYKVRGFNSIEEMNEAIVERWNSVVKPDDMIFHLGDMMLNNDQQGMELMKRLNGWISIVWGNHDTNKRKEYIYNSRFIPLGYAHQLQYHKFTCYLSHYPTLTSNWDDKHFSQHVINFHGHTHQRKNWLYPDNPFMYHVGMDSHDCYPVHIDTAITEIRNRWEEIGRLNIKPAELYNYPLEDTK